MANLLLGSGCFWGREFHLRRLPGILRTQVGFAGGHLEDPTYQQVCAKDTGHAEVVSVTYDARILRPAALLTEFFTLHNFEINRGKGTGQYRSAVFSLTDDEQLTTAHKLITRLREAGYEPATDVQKVDAFYPAEARHQQYCSSRGMTPARRDDTAIRTLLNHKVG